MLRQRRGGGGWERVFGEGCIGPVILKQDLEKSGCFKGGGEMVVKDESGQNVKQSEGGYASVALCRNAVCS